MKLIGNPQAIAAARQAIDDIIMSTREMQGGGGYGPPRGGGGYGPPGVPGVEGGAPGGGDPWRPGAGGGGYRGAPASGPGMTTMTVNVPNMAIGSLIGRGGEVVKRVQQVSGARVQISRDEGQEYRAVILSGRPDQCEFAKREIENIIEVKASGGGVVDPNTIGASAGGGQPAFQQG